MKCVNKRKSLSSERNKCAITFRTLLVIKIEPQFELKLCSKVA